MKKKTAITKLRQLQTQIDGIRKQLRVGAPGAVLYEAPVCALSDETVVVEADGFGGATAMVVEGNYPIDYAPLYERTFKTESAACNAAKRIVEKQVPADEVLD